MAGSIGAIGDQLKQQVSSQAQSQKERASEGLKNVALALRQTSQQLREQNHSPIAQYAEQGATQVEHLSGYLRQNDLGDIAADVERFARRQPMLFLGAAFGFGFLTARFLKSSGQLPLMSGSGPMASAMPGNTGTMSGAASPAKSVERSIEVSVPLHAAYNQWTQFEDFPKFMEGVREVRQLDSRSLHWRAEIAGKTEEWNAIITEQLPDQRVSWRNTSGAENSETVTFYSVGPATTRVTLRLSYRPDSAVETIGSALGLVERRVQGDLERFKQFIEGRGTATGAWRGEIHGGNVTRP